MTLFRRMGVRAGLTGLALIGTIGSAAAFSDSYSFGGLRWGSSPKEAASRLESQGFTVSGPVYGAQPEFEKQDAWGAFVKNDRGKRLVARGLVAGEKLSVQLVFGGNEQLQRIIVAAPNWDGTVAGADWMTGYANRLTAQLEKEYGRSREKTDPFGFVDTASWAPARDGSGLELYVRGTNGFMFYPSNTTSLRVHFWNDRYAGDSGTVVATEETIPGTQASTESVPVNAQPDLQRMER